jgi:minor curlin subunit
MIKTNNKNNTTKLPPKNNLVNIIAQFICVALGMSFSLVSFSQDRFTNADLQDSPLSLSLTTIVPITVNNQTQQLVISQYGIFNNVTVNQMQNTTNRIHISQNGINNNANVSQTGYDNFVNINQFGSDNLAEVIQDGDANVANIWQEGEQTFIVHQIGNDMVVNITQYQY